MNIFVITSALNADFGSFNYETKFEQLINSAKSVRDKSLSDYIILADGGTFPITFNQRKLLLNYYDDIFDLSQHTFIHSVQTSPNITALQIKGLCESYIMQHMCEIFRSDCTIQRIFKLSGRYFLTDKFNLIDHLNQKGKYVFKQRDNGVKLYCPETNRVFPFSPYQYQTRLYSFCGSLIENAENIFKSIKDILTHLYINNSFSIMEDAVYQLIPKELIVELEKIGVGGLRSDDRYVIDE